MQLDKHPSCLMQVINDSGTQVVDTWAFNAEDLSVSPYLTARKTMYVM